MPACTRMTRRTAAILNPSFLRRRESMEAARPTTQRPVTVDSRLRGNDADVGCPSAVSAALVASDHPLFCSNIQPRALRQL